MRLDTNAVRGDRRVEYITLTHREYELRWQSIERTSVEEGLDIFEQINAFWATRSQAWQDKVFEKYKDIHQLLSFSSTSVERIIRDLTDPVAELLDMHDLREIQYWVDNQSGLSLPKGVSDEYREEDNPRWTREKTYNTEDYWELVTLSIAIRPMIPIWGEFIFLTKRELKTMWKEYFSFQLIVKAKLMDSVPVNRLINYIKTHLPSEEKMQSVAMHGISLYDYPEWMLAITIVRRLSIADIRGLQDRPNPISFIHLYLSNRTSTYNNVLLEQIKPKWDRDSIGGDDERNASQFEMYKIKEELPVGDVVLIEYDIQEAKRIAKGVCPSLPLELLEASIERIMALPNKRLEEAQTILIQWVLAAKVSTRALATCQVPTQLKAMAITEAILWHRGFPHLAALVSANAQPEDEDFFMGVSTPTSRSTFDLKSALEPYYPLEKRLAQKSKSSKEKNPGVIGIELLTELFRKNDWFLTVPNEWLASITTSLHERKYVAPADLKQQLGQLLVQLNQHKGVFA